MQLASGVRTWFGHAYTKAAIALVVVGLLFIAIEVQSPSMLYWSGQPVRGTVDGGIIYYRVHGQSYSLDDTGLRQLPNGATVTMYVDPANPDDAMPERPAKWIDAATVLVWFAAAAGCLVFGAVRRKRRGRRTSGSIQTADWIESYVGRARADRKQR